MVETAVFYGFAGLLLFAATMVITVRNPVHAALSLVLAFVASSGLWLLLEAEFLAIALVLVYVGAVMVLFLFVVMMLDINLAVLREGFTRRLPLGVAVAAVMAGAMSVLVGPDRFGLAQVAAPARATADFSNTRELGRVLYTEYAYPFEIAAVVLLVAIVAAIALTMRPSRLKHHPRPEQQVLARRTDRVRLVKMPAVKDDQ